MAKDNFSSEVYDDKVERIFFCRFAFVLPQLMPVLVSHTSLYFFVLSFVLACACATGEDQALH